MTVARATAPDSLRAQVEQEDAEAASAISSSRNPLLIGVLLGLVLVVVGGGALLLGPHQADPIVPPVDVPEVVPPVEPVVVKPPPGPLVPESPADVVVRVVSVPDGVEVFEHGVMLGNAPLPLRRKPGTILELTLSLAGYQTAQRKVMVSADAAVVSVTLEKTKGAVVRPKPVQPPPSLDIKPVPF
jgi:hypothetical protein